MGESWPPSSDTEFWEPRAQELWDLLSTKPHGMALKAIKQAMMRKKVKVGLTVNLLAYLDLRGRVIYSRHEKVWYALKSTGDGISH